MPRKGGRDAVVKVAGKGINAFIRILKESIPDVQIIDDDTPQNIEDWDYFQKIKARLTPAKVLKIRRENANLTYAVLAEKCGIASANITGAFLSSDFLRRFLWKRRKYKKLKKNLDIRNNTYYIRGMRERYDEA